MPAATTAGVLHLRKKRNDPAGNGLAGWGAGTGADVTTGAAVDLPTGFALRAGPGRPGVRAGVVRTRWGVEISAASRFIDGRVNIASLAGGGDPESGGADGAPGRGPVTGSAIFAP